MAHSDPGIDGGNPRRCDFACLFACHFYEYESSCIQDIASGLTSVHPSILQRQSSSDHSDELYTPTTEEVAFAQAQVASKAGLFRLLILFKAFQRLGYFPPSAFIPAPAISHLRHWLKLPAQVSPLAPLRTLHRYQQAIRDYFRSMLIIRLPNRSPRQPSPKPLR
ncbi:DUF4158 domain-containing protein [Leptolyngbya sp. FACHB-321]|nr:DUF4158 domain-containing protein [Leptolyngbya sp. FACHB-321]